MAEPTTAAGPTTTAEDMPCFNCGTPWRVISAYRAGLDHPRTYSLTASGPNGELFLVSDDESGINIGYARKIGGPLTSPIQQWDPA